MWLGQKKTLAALYNCFGLKEKELIMNISHLEANPAPKNKKTSCQNTAFKGALRIKANFSKVPDFFQSVQNIRADLFEKTKQPLISSHYDFNHAKGTEGVVTFKFSDVFNETIKPMVKNWRKENLNVEIFADQQCHQVLG